jgi:hypothetical protein
VLRHQPSSTAPLAAAAAITVGLFGCRAPDTDVVAENADGIVPDAGTTVTTWLLILLGVLVLGVLTVIIARVRRRRAHLRGLFQQASTDCDWLLDDAVTSAAVADREPHTRDVRKRSDRLHDTLSALASAGGGDLAAACVELRTYANDLAGTLVARLADPTADNRDLDVQLSEKRERTRRAKERTAGLVP